MQFPCTCHRVYPGVQLRCKCSRRSCRASSFVARDVQCQEKKCRGACPKVTDINKKEFSELSCTEAMYRRATTKLVDNKQVISFLNGNSTCRLLASLITVQPSLIQLYPCTFATQQKFGFVGRNLKRLLLEMMIKLGGYMLFQFWLADRGSHFCFGLQ